MSSIKDPLPTVNPETKNKVDSVELSDEAIHSLTGYFDVLIQMDLAKKQRNERSNNATTLHSATDSTTQTN